MTKPTAGHLAWLERYGKPPETTEERELYYSYQEGFGAGFLAGWDSRGRAVIGFIYGHTS